MVRRISVGLLRVRGEQTERTGWSVPGERVRGMHGRFRLQLPRNLERANRLDILIRYRDRIGEANFWARLIPRPPP